MKSSGELMEMTERMEEAVTVLEVTGRVDSLTAPDLGERLTSLLSSPQQRLLIDCQRMDYISSAGFRVLFVASKKARDNGSRLAVCGLSAKSNELFEIADFHKLIKIVSTRAEGLAAVN
jgi:anti-sigma B factor antagonist/stage II sporulation protein AA (anti-sigma F factor antagonist)